MPADKKAPQEHLQSNDGGQNRIKKRITDLLAKHLRFYCFLVSTHGFHISQSASEGKIVPWFAYSIFIDPQPTASRQGTNLEAKM